MTNEQAIKLLHRLQDEQFDGIHGDERREALEMAVRALSGEGDTISRQEVLHELDWCDYELKDWQRCKLKTMVRDIPSAQPEITEDDVKEYCRKRCLVVVTSDFYNAMYRRWVIAQPQRKKGNWVWNQYNKPNIGNYHCSVCRNIAIEKYAFCPNCGADMRGEGDE